MLVTAMPHGIAFIDGGKLKSSLIVCSPGLTYEIEKVEFPADFFMLILSCYYVFDLEYFAAFGLLSILDRYILHPNEITARPRPSRSKKKKTSHGLSAFMEKLEGFRVEKNFELDEETFE